MTLSDTEETLLIVDDEPLITDLFRQTMTKRGYRVLSAGDSEEALALVRSEIGVIRLVITDMTMPGMDGIALAREISAIAPGMPVLIATGHETDAEQMGLPGNVVGIVKKPYQNRVLAETIREVLDSRRGG